MAIQIPFNDLRALVWLAILIHFFPAHRLYLIHDVYMPHWTEMVNVIICPLDSGVAMKVQATPGHMHFLTIVIAKKLLEARAIIDCCAHIWSIAMPAAWEEVRLGGVMLDSYNV